MRNLQAQIDGLEWQAAARSSVAVSAQAERIELVALRGHILGRIADYEWGAEQAEQLTREAPTDSFAFIARARTRGKLHCFDAALADLDTAERLGADSRALAVERAGILQAIGRYDEALAIYTDPNGRRTDFDSLGSLATLHAEQGDVAAAERYFDESRRRYRGVSPIPLALLDFQRGAMWLQQHQPDRARTWFDTAVRRVPVYAPAQGHLAEVQLALGKPEAAISRLLPLTASSDDPDYAASLARALMESGRPEQADKWRMKAAQRYEELITCHPEAFADHAAAFWLDTGADPDRAWALASMNVQIRPTPKAHHLLARASDRRRLDLGRP